MRNFNKYIWLVVLSCWFTVANSQTNPAQQIKTLLIGSDFVDTVYSKTPLTFQNPAGFQGFTVKISTGVYQFKLVPLNNFVGTLRQSVEYIEQGSGFKVKYLTYTLQYMNSIVKANTDYITVASNSTSLIDVLANDVTTASGLTIISIGNVQFGTANIVDSKIEYTASDSFTTDVITYTIKDSNGNQATGKVVVVSDDPNLVNVDTLRYTLLNLHKQDIVLPAGGFVMDTNNQPTKGTISQTYTSIFRYKPNAGATGVDDFSFTDSDDNHRVVIIKLIDHVINKSTVRNDKFYTTVNTPITFDVLANDINDKFPISSWSSALAHDTLGIFTYTPPSGYSGEKNFTYTVNYGGGNTFVGKIKIMIGNYFPKQNLDYTFQTLKNEAIVLEYSVPISGYNFTALAEPNYGSIEIFNDQTTLEVGCNEINNKSIIIYTPDEGYYGTDSFDIEYCVADTCFIYKLAVVIHNTDLTDACHCVGKDCVYKGDLNGDGRVSVSDLITLGKYLGLTGTSRTDSIYPYWGGQHADDWAFVQGNGSNAKMVDANGDGQLTKSDMDAIDTNYGNFNNLVPNEVLAVKDFPFYLVLNSNDLDSGDVLIMDLYYGTAAKPVINGFGLAFELNLPSTVVDSASVTGSFDANGWFANYGTTMQMFQQPRDGRIQAAFTKTGLIVEDELDGFIPMSFGSSELIVEDELDGFIPGVSGNGRIGQVSLIVEDELDGFKSGDEYISATIQLQDIEVEDIDGSKYTVPSSEYQIKIRRDKITTPIPTPDKLIIYPNPTNDRLNLHFNGQNIIKGYRVVDMMGQVVSQQTQIDNQSTSIGVGTYASGFYTVIVLTSEGTITRKVQVVR
jgi:Secretion system C-terminal sorting domain/Dockerin type I domain